MTEPAILHDGIGLVSDEGDPVILIGIVEIGVVLAGYIGGQIEQGVLCEPPLVCSDAQNALSVKNVLQNMVVVGIRTEGMINFLLISCIDDGDI